MHAATDARPWLTVFQLPSYAPEPKGGRSGLPVGGDLDQELLADGLEKPLNEHLVAAGFDEAMRAALRAEGGWAIGDNLTADIASGRAAGLRTVSIDRGSRRQGGMRYHRVWDLPCAESASYGNAKGPVRGNGALWSACQRCVTGG
ncbi:HAD hydrolase-like protein [Streptosporangium amethystogenes]|uniref:HAD hydrolase-like protein n=1 Tax=Streptosporangium amethystogenes TaxID=2002 RepID=UPI0004CAF123|nr:HAD hydrolase-like protein [Streptosporangium amethystogenes]